MNNQERIAKCNKIIIKLHEKRNKQENVIAVALKSTNENGRLDAERIRLEVEYYTRLSDKLFYFEEKLENLQA